MTNDPVREQWITRFGLQPLPGASRVSDAQIAQARQELRERRFWRIRAANEAVDTYMRESGTRHYPAAFTHILRTRPNLFAGMQDPSGLVAAANFNPYHDQLGRFTTSDDAVASHGQGHLPAHRPHLPAYRPHLPTFDVHGLGQHREHGARPAQRPEGKEMPSPAAIPSIRDYAKRSSSLQTCVVAAVRSLIDTMRAATNDHRPLPSEEEVEKQFAAALGRSTIDWSKGLDTPFNDHGATFARVIKDVLAQNGVSSHARFNYPSAKVLADEIRAAGVPVIANLITSDQGATIYEHAVLIQWDQKSSRFLVNNIDAMGSTKQYTKEEFESGTLRVSTKRTDEGTHADLPIDFHNAAIFAQRP